METPCIQDGAVSLRIEDDVAQDLLWEYALRLRSSDPTFATQLASELLAAGFVVGPDVPCATCHGTGIIETGNNDLPCACPVGSFARFNVTTAGGLKQMLGTEVRQHLVDTQCKAADIWHDGGEP